MSSIIAQLEAHIQARKDSVIALRGRIAALLAPIPTGVVLSDDAGEVCRVVRICTGASQWSNRKWEVTIYGRGYLSAAGLLLAKEIDESYHDGHNLHTRSTEGFYTIRRGELHQKLDFTTGAETRALAARLPVAVARYMEHCAAEAAANAAVLSPRFEVLSHQIDGHCTRFEVWPASAEIPAGNWSGVMFSGSESECTAEAARLQSEIDG